MQQQREQPHRAVDRAERKHAARGVPELGLGCRARVRVRVRAGLPKCGTAKRLLTLP